MITVLPQLAQTKAQNRHSVSRALAKLRVIVVPSLHLVWDAHAGGSAELAAAAGSAIRARVTLGTAALKEKTGKLMSVLSCGKGLISILFCSATGGSSPSSLQTPQNICPLTPFFFFFF